MHGQDAFSGPSLVINAGLLLFPADPQLVETVRPVLLLLPSESADGPAVIRVWKGAGQ